MAASPETGLSAHLENLKIQPQASLAKTVTLLLYGTAWTSVVLKASQVTGLCNGAENHGG